MLNEQIFKEALNIAQQEELRTGRVIKEVYILGDEIFLNKHDLKGHEQDYTLIRSDMDEKFPSSINTEKPEEKVF